MKTPSFLRFSSLWSLLIVLILFAAGMASCDKEKAQIDSYLNHIPQQKYYNKEILKGGYNDLYGAWRLYDVSGGFTGTGHDLHFDWLEIKSYGIYGIVRNDTLLSHGRIVVEAEHPDHLQLGFFRNDEVDEPLLAPAMGMDTRLEGRDTLHLSAPCCDQYNYHFVRRSKGN